MKQATSIPNKLYFRIGEVADLLAVKPYVLRYWETEFPDIKPSKSKSGQRLYKRRDVEMLVRIKDLLYQDRFTINGARKRLKELMREQRGYEPQTSQTPLELPQEAEETPAPTAAVKTASNNMPHQVTRQAPTPSPQSTLDSKKIFLKIKRDLESMLDYLK